MKLLRRQFLKFAGAIAAVPAVSKHAAAEDYPTRPVRIVASPQVAASTSRRAAGIKPE